jgi:hypothetical protein
VDTGTGLVFCVTLLVKSLILPTTLEEKPWTPLTTEAAKSEPGRCGKLGLAVGMEEGETRGKLLLLP